MLPGCDRKPPPRHRPRRVGCATGVAGGAIGLVVLYVAARGEREREHDRDQSSPHVSSLGWCARIDARSAKSLPEPKPVTLADVDDLELLARWRSGDNAAGNELCARHFDAVYRFFEYKVEDPHELIQNTFLKFVRSRDAFRGEASVRTYVLVIARRELLQHYRGRPKQEQVELHSSSLENLTSSMRLKHHRDRETERLMVALRKLKADEQLLLELHYWQDLDAPALAKVFELEPGAVRVRLHRARKALRKAMDEDVLAKLREDPLVSSVAELDADPA